MLSIKYSKKRIKNSSFYEPIWKLSGKELKMETLNTEQQNTENAEAETRKVIRIICQDMGRIFLFFGMAGLTVLVLFQVWKILELERLNEESWGQLAICFGMVYLLASGTAICMVATIKEGFKNLKPINKEGLISYLTIGFISGLTVGILSGLVRGPIFGLAVGLVMLICGLFNELTFGLANEFRQ